MLRLFRRNNDGYISSALWSVLDFFGLSFKLTENFSKIIRIFAYLYIRFYEKLPVYYENQRHNHIKHLAFPILGDSTTTERDDQEGTSGFHKAVYGILTEIYQCDLPQG